MKVALICPEFPPNAIGGGGVVFSALSRHLPLAGVELDIICGNYRGGAQTWSDGRVTYTEIPLLPTPAVTPFMRTILPPTPSGWRTLRRLISVGSYDVAHLHGVSFALIDGAAHLLHRIGVPWVFTLHGAPRTPYRLGGALRALYASYLRGYGSFAMRYASIRTAVSAAATSFPPIAEYMNDARIVTNGIEVDAFASHMPEREIRTWPKDPGYVMLSVGRVEHTKGFDIGVRALARMRTDAQYVVVGEDCGEVPRLRRLAKELGVSDRFFTVGAATSEQVRFALRRASIAWVPSRNESFGLFALEAMAAGLPVVSSGVEGLREIFTGSLDSLLMNAPDDAADLASKSDALLADRSESLRIGETFRERARAFDWSFIAQRYADCYRAALQTAESPR
jgi:glycosyltransferase involved in cell wall biosynthesis